jgi:hypothetical protein
MTGVPASQRRLFRPAVAPVFSILFVFGLATAIITYISCSPSPLTLEDFVVGFIKIQLPAAIIVSAMVTFIIWRFTAEVLSPDGAGVLTLLGRRQLLWEHVEAVQTFPSIKLIYIKFSLRSGRFRRVLFFQRRPGELREMIADLVSKESFVWKQLNNA